MHKWFFLRKYNSHNFLGTYQTLYCKPLIFCGQLIHKIFHWTCELLSRKRWKMMVAFMHWYVALVSGCPIWGETEISQCVRDTFEFEVSTETKHSLPGKNSYISSSFSVEATSRNNFSFIKNWTAVVLDISPNKRNIYCCTAEKRNQKTSLPTVSSKRYIYYLKGGEGITFLFFSK